MGLFNRFKKKRTKDEQKIGSVQKTEIILKTSDNGNIVFKKKIGSNEVEATREEAEEQVENLKRKYNDVLNVDVNIAGVDTNIDLSETLNQPLDDAIIENYGTNEEKENLRKRKAKEKADKEAYDKIKTKLDKAKRMNDRNSIRLYREVIDEAKNVGLSDLVISAYHGLIDTYQHVKHFDEAIETANESIEFKKQHNEDYSFEKRRIASMNLGKYVQNNKNGEKLEEEGQIDEAIVCYEDNVRLNADTPFTYDRLSSLYHYKKDFQSEKKTLEKGIRMCKNNPNPSHVNRMKEQLENVNSFLNNGKWKFDCLPSDQKPSYQEIKKAKEVLKEDKEKGRQMLENIMQNGTYNNTVYNTLYQSYKKDKEFDEAIRVCHEAIDVLGFFSEDRKERWNINLERVTKQKEKAEKKKNS